MRCAKNCSYACIYCQLGHTLTMQTEKTDFYDLQRIFEEVRKKVKDVTTAGEPVDYLAFVPDGEPTLDLNLGRSIRTRPLRFSAAAFLASARTVKASFPDFSAAMPSQA